MLDAELMERMVVCRDQAREAAEHLLGCQYSLHNQHPDAALKQVRDGMKLLEEARQTAGVLVCALEGTCLIQQ